MLRRFLRFLLPSAVLVALAGCIVVADFGEYWNRGFIDHCVNEIAAHGQDYRDPRGAHPSSIMMRSLRLGKHTFLMIREDLQNKGGSLLRYRIENGAYIAYRLNESRREDFARDYPDSTVVVTSETATIPVLTEKTAALLSKLADDASYWVESRREPYNSAKRRDCITPLY